MGSHGPRSHVLVRSLFSQNNHVYCRCDSHPSGDTPPPSCVPAAGACPGLLGASSFPQRTEAAPAGFYIRVVVFRGRVAHLQFPAAFLGCSVRLNLPLLAPGPSSCSLTVTLSLLRVFSPPGVLCLLLFGALLFVRWCFKPQVTLVTFSAVSDLAMFRWRSPGAAGHVCLLVPWQLSFAAFKCFILHQLCKPGPTCFTPHDTL